MQLNREEILERLKEILITADDRKRNEYENCTEDMNLYTDLGLSSIGMLYIVIAVEETFQIRFSGVGMGDFKTVGDVVSFIEAHQS